MLLGHVIMACISNKLIDFKDIYQFNRLSFEN
jgi:hypothetical protein